MKFTDSTFKFPKLLVAFILFFSISFSGLAQSYNAMYAKDIAITEPFGKNQTDYIQYLEINTSSLVSAGKMQADGDDIRFVADCGQNDYIDYYIHRGMNTTKTEIYVRVPSISASQTDTIQMLYGDNSAAGGSSFSATFPDSLITNGSNVTDSGIINAGWIHIKSGDTLFMHTNAIMDLRAAYIQIDGVIDGVGKGNQSGTGAFSTGGGSGGGTGSSSSNAGSGGGGYGGDGGDGGYDSGDSRGLGGSANGSDTSKAIRKGSAGSTAASNTRGGHGGGSLSIQCAKFKMSSGKIFVDGTDGTTAAGQCPGGGSGGGVLILGDSISIGSSASISAEGGDGKTGTSTANDGGGGGSGGRVKIFGDAHYSSSPTITVDPGAGGGYGGAAYGQAGDTGTTHVASWTYASYTVGSELLAGPFSVLSNKDTVCAGTPVTLTVTNPGSITWSTGDTIDSTIVTPMATTSYYVYGTSASGCITSDTTEIFVPTPAVDLGPDTNNCGPITLDAVQTGGAIYIWSTGDTAATTNITNTGTYSVTASIAGCTVADTITMTIDTIPIVTLTTSLDSICEGDTVQLTGSPASGSFIGLGVSGSEFRSSVSGSGLQQQVYGFTDANGCFDRDTSYVYVQAQPVVTLGATTFNTCIGNTEVLRGFPSGGVYSGPGVTDSIFNTLTTGLGTYGVSYLFTDSIGCSGTAADSVTVNGLPVVGLTIALDSMCIGVNTTMTGTPTGGSYSGAGVTHINFNSTAAGPGVHNPVYSYRDANLCWNYDTIDVVVNPNPTVVLIYDDTICINTSTPLSATPTGGTFTGTGVVNNNSFDASGLGTGFRNFTYDVTDVNGCFGTAQGRMLIRPAPINLSVTFDDDSLCEGEETKITESHLGTGVLTGTGVNDSIWSSAGLSPGTYEVYYEVTNADGCSTYDTSSIVVNANPNVSVDLGQDTLCLGDSIVLLVSPAGGILSGSGLIDSLFVSSLTGVGSYTFNYEYTTAEACFGADSVSLVVDSCKVIPQSVYELNGIGLQLYPNPTQGVVNVYLEDASAHAHLEVLNALGQVLSKEEIRGGQINEINIEGPTGIYFIDLKMDDEHQRIRIVKRR